MEPIKEHNGFLNNKKNKTDLDIKYPLELTNRYQRLILYNMIAFIWSLLYLIYYLESVYFEDYNTNSNDINRLYLSYFVMIFVGSLSIIITKCIELKEWIDFNKNKQLRKLIIFIHNFVSLVYFVSVLIHIGITWRQSTEICVNRSNIDNTAFCRLTFISSGFLSIYISWTLFIDCVKKKSKNVGSRMQFMMFFISILLYLICMIHYRNEWKYSLSIIGEVGQWILLFSYFFSLTTDCIPFMNYKTPKCIISLMMITGAIIGINRNKFIFDGIVFYHEGSFLTFAFSGFLAYQLHRKQRRRRMIMGEKEESVIAAEDSMYGQYKAEGSGYCTTTCDKEKI